MKRQSFYIILELKDTKDEQKLFGTQAFRGVYLRLTEEIEHDQKVTLTP